MSGPYVSPETGEVTGVTAKRGAWGVSGSVSLALHFIGALAITLAPTTAPQASVREPGLYTIEITTPVPNVPVPPPAPTIDPPCCLDSHPAPRRREPRHPIAPAVVVEDPVTPRLDPVVGPARPEEEEVHRPTISLDPSHVVALLVPIGPGPSMPGLPAGLDDDSPDRQPTPIGEAIAIIEGSLGEDANRTSYSERPYPVHPRPDGSFVYDGIGFDGIIERDGSIHFSDRPELGYDAATGSGSFDLMDLIMRSAGQDPYMSERLGFLHETEALQERLEGEARAAAHVRSLTRIRGTAARIWQDETRSPAERRRALFELWDEQADGDEGAPARDAVMAFIREEQTFGGDMAFGATELARLNGARESVERFEP